MPHDPGEFPSLLWVPVANLSKTRWNDWSSRPVGYKHVYLLQTPGSCHIKKMDEDSTDQEILLKGHLFHGWEFQGLEREGMTWSSFSLYMVFSCREFRSHLRHSIIKAVAVIAVYSIGDLVFLSIKWERQPCPPYSVRDASSNLVWKPNEGWMGLNPSYSSFLPGPWFLAQGTAHNDTY